MINATQKKFLLEILGGCFESDGHIDEWLIGDTFERMRRKHRLNYRHGEYTYYENDAKVNDFIRDCGLWAEDGMYAEGIILRCDAIDIYDESANYLEDNHMTEELSDFFDDTDNPRESISVYMYVNGCSDYTYVKDIEDESEYPIFTEDDIKKHFDLSDEEFNQLVKEAQEEN